jgi:CRISPR-associated Cas5-like protein
MDVLCVDVVGVFNSFREPNAQRYQKTLILPPPTTIAGFFCAAVGWESVDALLSQAGVSVALLEQKGYGKDLWKYHKRKSGKDIPTPDVLFREFQYGNTYRLFLFGDRKLVKDFAEALKNPTFALTLGSSEELVNIRVVHINNDLGEPILLSKFKNTIIPGDHRGGYKPNIDRSTLRSILYNLTPPEFIHMPVLFDYDANKGRTPKRVEPITLTVGFELELQTPLRGYQIDGFSIVPCGPYYG